ncbi:J domain-containing protein [Roseibium aestuarii]|uniref:TerB family tellurite resistance protein n=1 Tax=Roseibium aestuarii TaxID=2600299 RepID=A0ABW4JYA5_9HYPH|nr:DnaJ family molecular chaperone [Roseibium aestuarii]
MSVWSSLASIVSAIGSSSVQLVDRLVQLVLAKPEGTNTVGFTVAMIALSAKMAKADGIVTNDEILAFGELFQVPEGEERNVARLFNLAKEDVAGFEVYAKKLADLFPYDRITLIDILDGLFHIAKADGVLHENELAYLERVAEIFGLDAREFDRILSRHARRSSDPYKVLGVDPSLDDDALKRHFRQAVRQTHPDQLIARGVPQEFVRIANDRLAALNAAWDQIRAERSL